MTAPSFVACRCGHDRMQHPAQHAGMCTSPGCSCTDYRAAVGQFAGKPAPQTSPRPPVAAVAPSPATAATPEKLATVLSAVDQAPSVVDTVPSLDELMAKALASELKPIIRLADRITELAIDLQERVAGEAAAAGVKAHIAKLERQLAAEKAKLKKVASGRRTPPAAKNNGELLPCPDCERTFDTPQGVGAHRSRSHGYRKVG